MFYDNLNNPNKQRIAAMYNPNPSLRQMEDDALFAKAIEGMNGLQKAEELGILSGMSGNDLEKGRIGMPIGAHANWGGVDYLKTASGWKPAGKFRGHVKENHDHIHKNEDQDKDHHALTMDAGKMDEKEWTAKHGSNLHTKYKAVHDYLHKPKAEKKEVKSEPVEEKKEEHAEGTGSDGKHGLANESESDFKNEHLKIKEKYKDAIVVHKNGDKYKAVGDDAKKFSEATGTKLTKNESGTHETEFNDGEFDKHVTTAVKAGHKVALSEKPEEVKKIEKKEKPKKEAPAETKDTHESKVDASPKEDYSNAVNKWVGEFDKKINAGEITKEQVVADAKESLDKLKKVPESDRNQFYNKTLAIKEGVIKHFDKVEDKKEGSIPKILTDLHLKRSTLEFTKNALKMQMGGKPLVGKSKNEYDNVVSDLDDVESQISRYDKKPDEIKKEVEVKPKIEKPVEDIKVNSDYGNYLLDEIEREFKIKFPKDENIKQGLAKYFNETMNDRGELRATSNLEDILTNYMDNKVGAAGRIRQGFESSKKIEEKKEDTATSKINAIADKAVEQYNNANHVDKAKLKKRMEDAMTMHENALKNNGKGLDETMVAAGRQFLKKVADPDLPF